MSWPVRSKLLAAYNGAAGAANAKVSLGFVPAGKTWLVKEWCVYNGTAGNKTTLLQVYNGATGYNIDTTGVLGAGSLSRKGGGSLVLPAGYELAFNQSTTGLITVYVSGAQLG